MVWSYDFYFHSLSSPRDWPIVVGGWKSLKVFSCHLFYSHLWPIYHFTSTPIERELVFSFVRQQGSNWFIFTKDFNNMYLLATSVWLGDLLAEKCKSALSKCQIYLWYWVLCTEFNYLILKSQLHSKPPNCTLLINSYHFNPPIHCS